MKSANNHTQRPYKVMFKSMNNDKNLTLNVKDNTLACIFDNELHPLLARLD